MINRMNCPHRNDGWCFKCVQILNTDNNDAKTLRMKALTKALELAVIAYDEIMDSNLPPLVKASFSTRFDGEKARRVLKGETE